jgi:hypothetical protein
MKHNSRSSLSEVWNVRGGFSEPDAELVGLLIRHRRELASWMRTALEHSSTGKGWDGNPDAFLRGHPASWLQEKNQFFRAHEGPRGNSTRSTSARS